MADFKETVYSERLTEHNNNFVKGTEFELGNRSGGKYIVIHGVISGTTTTVADLELHVTGTTWDQIVSDVATNKSKSADLCPGRYRFSVNSGATGPVHELQLRVTHSA